ncbi:MAG: pyridoxamine 5'-phosphate oxidase family protein [Ferruginibacter sp.]
MKYINDSNLEFLKNKISNIKVALFKSEMNSELQLPNNIIQVIKMDDSGNIWFFTSCIHQQAGNLNRNFYAYLDFYRKGFDERLKISGRATIVNEDEMNESLFSKSNYSIGTAPRLVLVKLNIMQAEYLESRLPIENNESIINKIKSAFLQTFFSPSHKIFDFS